MGPHSTDHFWWIDCALVGGNAGWNERCDSRVGAYRSGAVRASHLRQSPLRRSWRFGAGLADRPVWCGLVDADQLDGRVPVVGQPAAGVRQLVHGPDGTPAVVHQRHSIPFGRAGRTGHRAQPEQLGTHLGLVAMQINLRPGIFQGMGHAGHRGRVGRSGGLRFVDVAPFAFGMESAASAPRFKRAMASIGWPWPGPPAGGGRAVAQTVIAQPAFPKCPNERIDHNMVHGTW